MEKEERNLNQFDTKLAKMSNNLARRLSGETTLENKLLMMAVSQLNPHGENSNIIRLRKKDVFEKLDLTETNRYMRVKKALTKLTKSSFVDLTKDNIKGDFEGIMGYVLPAMETSYKSEFYEIEVSSKFLPHMQLLKSFYTTMELDSIVSFVSVFSHRLYQYICSWQDMGESYLKTKELKELFNLEKDDYVRPNGLFDRYTFERKTIDVAIAEINEKSEFRISYEKIKSGNRVRGYKLTWRRVDELEKKQTRLEEFINQNIDWKFLLQNNKELFVMAIKAVYEEVMNGTDEKTYKINGNRLSAVEVKEGFKSITTGDIVPILEKLDDNPDIKHPRNWIMTALHNARLNSKYSDQHEIDNLSPDFDRISKELEEFFNR